MCPLLFPNPYIAGAALRTERGFFGREDILRDVGRTLSQPDANGIVLYGQRRIGKTSILLQLRRRLPSPPFVPIYFDLMDKAGQSMHQVLFELAVTAAYKVGLPLPEKADFEENPDAFHSLFLPKLYEVLKNRQRPVFLLDEFDVLALSDERGLPETAAAHSFRPYLDRLMTTETRLAFVFVVGRRMEDLSSEVLSTFKAALARSVSVLKPEEARALVLLAEREGVLRYQEGAVERILSLTRGHPYFTQLTCQTLFERVLDPSPDDTPNVTADDVEQVIPSVLEAGGNAFQWIWDGLPPAERITFSAIASQTREGTVLSSHDITSVLHEAGIRSLVKELDLAPKTLVSWQMLEQIDGGYRFFVELMRRWVKLYRPLYKVKDELDRINPAANSLYQAAHSLYQQGDNDRAVVQLRQALELNPNHLKARLLLGTILREDGHLAEAAAEFELAYRQDEREGRSELLSTLVQLGEAREKAGNEEHAVVAYERALAISPREPSALAHRAALWEKQGDRAMMINDFESAIAAYRQAGTEKKLDQAQIQKRKLDLEQAAQEGQAYEARAEWAKAADIYRRLAELDPDNERWQQAESYARGASYLQQGKWRKAQKTLAGVIAEDADYRDAATLLTEATQRALRRLYLVGAAVVVAFLLAMSGLWIYSQGRVLPKAAQTTEIKTPRSSADSLTARAAATAQSAETEGAEAIEAIKTGPTATTVAAARAAQTAMSQPTGIAATTAAETDQAPTATSTRSPTPSPIATPTASSSLTAGIPTSSNPCYATPEPEKGVWIIENHIGTGTISVDELGSTLNWEVPPKQREVPGQVPVQLSPGSYKFKLGSDAGTKEISIEIEAGETQRSLVTADNGVLSVTDPSPTVSGPCP
jgi:tetratricopeptide (TPR) repeat protein